jgi:hypothetical protein
MEVEVVLLIVFGASIVGVLCAMLLARSSLPIVTLSRYVARPCVFQRLVGK